MTNLKTKFTRDMIEYISARQGSLSDWEKQFLKSIKAWEGELTRGQFNKLESIYQNLRKRG